MKIDFKNQIKDPRWQKVRLEILERDDFTCTDCGETEKTLHVHHTYYLKNTNIWDYPEYSLVTLCEDCHKEVTEQIKNHYKNITTRPSVEEENLLNLLRHYEFSESCVNSLMCDLYTLISEGELNGKSFEDFFYTLVKQAIPSKKNKRGYM